MVITLPLPKYGNVSPKYPAKLSKNDYGKCLVASEDLGRGEAVARFEGRIVSNYAEVPPEEICYALVIGIDHYMIVGSSARYINHSCDPNCTIDEDYYVVTTKPVKKGDEFTFRYNDLDPIYEGMECFWDPRWTFTCRCGSANCIGKIDRYVNYEGLANNSKD